MSGTLDPIVTSLWFGFFVFLRVGAIVFLLPAFGEQTIPTRFKLIIAILLTFVVSPLIEFGHTPHRTGIALALLTEPLIGLLVGVSLRLFVLVLQTAGSIAAQSTSLSHILGGAAAEPVPALGYILALSGMTLALVMDFHVKVVAFLLVTYDVLPIGLLLLGQNVGEWGASQVNHAFALAFALSVPFVLVSIIYNVTLGVINKAMPQLMVAFVGAPVITLGALVVLFVAAPSILFAWWESVQTFMLTPFGVYR